MLAIRLPPEVEARLARLAKRTGRTKTYYAREAIVEHLDNLEDLYTAEKRYAAVVEGKSKTYALEDVERVLGLEG
jgi:RHH-type rel operon transcriptional repressor/antitoxin RelB